MGVGLDGPYDGLVRWLLALVAIVGAVALLVLLLVGHPRVTGGELVWEGEVNVHCGLGSARLEVDGVIYRFAEPETPSSPEDVRPPAGWGQLQSVDVYDTGEGLVAVGPLWSVFRLVKADPTEAESGCL
jgi:hypothetical protein